MGLIHTLGPAAIRGQITAAALAPVHPWDALICTSPAVKAVVERLFEQQERWHAERFAASHAPRPCLPLIRLGVDVPRLAQQASSAAARISLWARLGLDGDDVLLLWVGRLSYFEKAFPQAMLQAVHQAAGRTERRLVLALAGWFPNGEADRNLYLQAAADVFLSLVDNIQETFGLAP